MRCKHLCATTSLLLGMFSISVIAGCSFHPSRRVLVDEITIELRANPPLTIERARAFEDNATLCVEGIVHSSASDHSNQRGIIAITTLSKNGEILESKCGLFSSKDISEGFPRRLEHDHTNRRFDIRLRSNPEDVSKLILVPLPIDAECPSK